MKTGEYRNRIGAFHGVTEYLGEFGIFHTGDREIHINHLIHPTGEIDVTVNGTYFPV